LDAHVSADLLKLPAALRRQLSAADEFDAELSICRRPVRLQKASGLAALLEEKVMQYILLIYENEAEAKARNPEESKRIFAEYGALTGAIKQSGHLRAGEPLQPTSTATTVRVKGGKTVRTDGPFAETREQLGGFYIVDAKDLDEAVDIAARIPSAKTGSIEVRPIMMMNAM
jgi:hypothetical protein